MKRFEIQIKDEPGPRIIVADRIIETDGTWLFYDDTGNLVGKVEMKAAATMFSTEIDQSIEEPPAQRAPR